MATTMEMSKGNLISQIIKFTIPLILTNLLQQMYTIIDNIIAGKLSGTLTLAAIGATGHLNSLLTNLLIGIGVGVSAVVAQTLGEGKEDKISRTVHTAIGTSIAGGLLISVIGVIFCKPLLSLLGTPEAIIDSSAAYMRVFFSGYVMAAVYNFGAAILRAKGDTKRPLYFLAISGLVKIICSLIFVGIFKLGVRSIALSSVISYSLSAVLVVLALMRQDDSSKLYLKKIRIYAHELIRILKMGVPIGIQTSMFSISNVLIQSSINSFGEIAVAGSSAANNINSLLYAILTSMSHTSTIFCSQNFGAKQYDRLLKSLYLCLGFVVVAWLLSGAVMYMFVPQILNMFVSGSEAIAYGTEIGKVICATYFLCGWMEVVSGGLRAINKSTHAMVSSIVGLCGLRIVWVYTYFASHRSLGVLYWSYPLSWILTLSFVTILFIYGFRKIKKTSV